MCGRYTVAVSADQLAAAFGVSVPADFAPRYNVAPGQPVPAVGRKADGRTRGLTHLVWGFVPRWAESPTTGPRPINAKVETVGTNPAFRRSFADRRCLLPATGFYEWSVAGGRETPVHFRPADGLPVALAGVWDVWRPPAGGPPLFTCAVVTVPASPDVAPIHARMPALLTADRFETWLAADTPAAGLRALLVPYPGRLDGTLVGPRVNSPKHDDPECLEPAEPTSPPGPPLG